MAFKRATKEKSKLRLALMGPTGSGKTYTALAVAHALGTKVAVIDSERGTASKYSDLFPPFDSCGLCCKKSDLRSELSTLILTYQDFERPFGIPLQRLPGKDAGTALSAFVSGNKLNFGIRKPGPVIRVLC